VTRKIQYDDLYRVKRIDHEYAAGDDTWTSPFAPELASIDDPRRAEPSPHVAFDKRILWQTFNYDWLGNTSKTDDDARGFYDRSLGTVTNDTAGDKPYQLKSATNDALGGARTGAVDTVYDAAGNLTRLDVERNGTCLGAQCSQRFEYRWDEVGRLVRARRWDVAGSSLTTPDAALPNDSEVDADVEYIYDASDDRVLKTARAGSAAVHTAYLFDTLELRRTAFQDGDYTSTTGSGVELTESEVPYLFGHGVRLARVVYEQVNDGEPRVTSSGRLHVFFELGDHLGSTSVVLDKETSELVERGAFQAYGAKESDYRPDRWKGFREDYGFTGKEEDVEVGLTYFGRRFLSPYLGRWVSADPLGVHAPGEADLNLYAYVAGAILKAVDPLGLDPKQGSGGQSSAPSDEGREGAAGTDDQRRTGMGYEGEAGAALDAAAVWGVRANPVGAALMLCGDSPCKDSAGKPTQAEPVLAIGAGAVASVGRGLLTKGVMRSPTPRTTAAPAPAASPAPARPTPAQIDAAVTKVVDDLSKARTVLPEAKPSSVRGPTAGSAAESSGTGKAPLWSATKNKSSAENGFAHWQKHGAEFPGIQNAKQYVERATDFVTSPPPGTLSKVRQSDGATILYHKPSNTFAIRGADGAPRTMFKPDPAKHGRSSNLAYYNEQ
jgi:RHS repeat-associated protein